jgi:hypothetical protein
MGPFDDKTHLVFSVHQLAEIEQPFPISDFKKQPIIRFSLSVREK